MPTSDDAQVLQKQELLHQLLRRQWEQDAQEVVPAAPIAAPARPLAQPFTPADPPRRRVAQSAAQPATQAVAVARRTPRTQRAAVNHFDTSIFTQDQVDYVGIAFVRSLAVLLLIASFGGSILAFNGRYTPSWRFWEGISPIAATAGIVVQSYLTLIEWWHSTRRWNLVYLGHVAVDALLSFMGFWLLLGPWFTAGIATVFRVIPLFNPLEPSAQLVAQLLLAVGSVIIARLPEMWLIKK